MRAITLIMSVAVAAGWVGLKALLDVACDVEPRPELFGGDEMLTEV